MRFLNPKTDYAFRKIFGSEAIYLACKPMI